MAESFFATSQTELLDRCAWQTLRRVPTAFFDYVEVFYNRQRCHSTLGYLSPAEYEGRWNAHQESAMLRPI